MREIKVQEITDTVERLCIQANNILPSDVLDSIQSVQQREKSPMGRQVLEEILRNAEIASLNNVPLCQDTGLAVVFFDLGQQVILTGGDVNDAINEGVRRGYTKGYLRKSVVEDPIFERKNTGDNTPAIIHTRIVPGNRIRIILAPKGGGSENMSALRMLKPSDGVEGIMDFVVETVNSAGSNPCPPIIVGVGVGGTIEIAALKSKQALLRKLGQHAPQAKVAELETELLSRINRLGIGPQGFGGTVTALAVNVEVFPAHIATLPVAVNLQCHVARHVETVL